MRLGALLFVAILSGCYDTHGDSSGHPADPEGLAPVPPPAPDPAPAPAPDPAPAPAPDPAPAPPPPDPVVDPGPAPYLACDAQLPERRFGDYTNGVAVQDGLAYVVYEGDDGGGLEIVDMTGEVPVVLGELVLSDALQSVELLADGEQLLAGGNRLHRIDVSDPTDPTELASVPLDDRANGISAQGDVALVATGYAGVDVFDISGPLPQRVSSLPDVWYAWDVELDGGVAWVATGLYDSDDSGLQVLDVADPWSPSVVARLDTAGAVEVEVAAPWVFLGDAYGTVRVIDGSEPSAPEAVLELPVNDDLRAMTLAGDRLLVAGLGVWFVDVADPPNAGLLGTLNLDMWIFDLAVEGDRAYAAGQGIASFGLGCTR